ncbi:predicted protein [Nematostella vectensis]|uniref:SH3 domain-containing protein n=1 Tax=Nematostella vectensis TaxID=45351 RepID=A7SVZ7_NEMVE|nr:predicted protein [Nematostella vectensis]|eukprot:XP_001624233.1 predicted protein [Nematostella vectensis]
MAGAWQSGYLPVNDESYAIQFYLVVSNNQNSKLTVSTQKPKCCWQVEPGDTDCESMVLIGGNEVVVSPKSTANITFIFPTLYPLDRIGKCHFGIKAKGHTYQHVTLFNTTEPRDAVDWKESLEGFGGGYKECAGVDLVNILKRSEDQDPRNDCKPVNCMDKYNGKRTFFDKERGKCVPAHNCYTKTDDEKALPDIAFDKDNNGCKSLISEKLTDKQIKFLHDKADKSSLAIHRYNLEDVKEINPIPLNCNHGRRVGSVCVCNDGWGTDTTVVPGGEMRYIYNWCNLELRSKRLMPTSIQKTVMITVSYKKLLLGSGGGKTLCEGLLIGWIIIIWGCFIASDHDDLPAHELADRLDSGSETQEELSDASLSDRPRHAVVHTSYRPKNPDELCLEKGQHIRDIRECKRRGWMKGSLQGKGGVFPNEPCEGLLRQEFVHILTGDENEDSNRSLEYRTRIVYSHFSVY